MSVSSLWETLHRSALESDEAFRTALRNALKRVRMSVKDFSRVSGVSESTLYKLLSGDRVNLRLSTYRRIVKALMKVEGAMQVAEPFIAIIAARPTLDAIERRSIRVRGREIQLREYAITSVEEAIIAAIRAEREGAKAIICAPIVSTTVEKVVNIPVSACPVALCRDPILKAAELAALKVLRE